MINTDYKIKAIICSLHHFENFVLNDSKITPLRRSTKKSVTLLIPFVFSDGIVRMGKIGITVVVLVTFVCDVKVMPTCKKTFVSESWADIIPIKNCKLFIPSIKSHFSLLF